MKLITLISTTHINNGKCNAKELCNILVSEKPEVIFIEALEKSYTAYDREKYTSFGVYHEKLEIEAIQRYSNYDSFNYVPVLDNVIPESFDKKYKILYKSPQIQKMIEELDHLTRTEGFQFLNSQQNMVLQKKMRTLENKLLGENTLSKKVDSDIEFYENTMIQNIYTYCKNNAFSKGVFMCGSAHRESIIGKANNLSGKGKLDTYWQFYGN